MVKRAVGDPDSQGDAAHRKPLFAILLKQLESNGESFGTEITMTISRPPCHASFLRCHATFMIATSSPASSVIVTLTSKAILPSASSLTARPSTS